MTRTLTGWALAFAFAFAFAFACGSAEEAPTEAPAASPAPPPGVPDPDPDPLLEEPEDEGQRPPALGEAQLDAMEQPELEAACFAGSTAACDRLGH